MICTLCQTPVPPESRFCLTCGADLSDPEVSTRTRTAVRELFEALKGAVQDRYVVTTMLGRGGMGAVFLAEDLRLGRTVAIKVLRPELANETSFVGRFEREARIAARLDHPNIIPIYAVERESGLHYFVMKYIKGKSLDELLTGKPLPIEQVRQILWQAACGLGHAHSRGVIHRDVKPSNFMIDDEGRVVVTDFGISKALQADTQFTNTGEMLGTPRYMSPDQAQGAVLDGRSDQYSLAVVGYQALVGRLPLVAETVHALMYKHIYETPPRADAARPEIPTEIADAIHRALAKSPDDRFPTMEEFATALWPERAVRAGQPAMALPELGSFAGLGEQDHVRIRRRAALGAAFAAVGVVLFLLLSRRSPSTESGDSGTVREPAEPTTMNAPAPLPVPDGAPAPAGDSVRVMPTGQAPDSAGPQPPTPVGPRVPPSSPPVPKPTPRREPRRAAQPPAEAMPPVPVMGYVTINAVPYGTVTIDGLEVGDTPIVRRQLPPGEHEVRIIRPGFRSETLNVTVTAGNEVRVSRSLIKDSL